ncbi:SDR family NAD(P)-dependent oxidoreductase [Paraburkholderia sp. DHOC27]|uniref:SDR family NAD(P)-dependent oxidoreductase n=1 Tax=Paraburkholderia sp. DHOC27 TaxID=2303330 RepID=UPI000E3B7E40|nr:SDR family oxidoreductase [Paraburkholderia sp. DHOC27]RFU49757.1 SDR family oxidoreductase [Paraburkholderia sp. DHOC27]
MNDILSCFAPDILTGKTALVSGGSSGIGLEIAKGLAGLGATVLATGSSSAKIDQLTREASTDQLTFECLDVTSPEAIASFAVRFDEPNRLDILVNSQGISRPGQEYDDATFLNVMDINLTSAMRLSTAMMPHLKRSQGTVINIASMLSYLADEEVPAYCASKSGILGLTRALAHRHGRDGVRVNAIAPGYHRTAMTHGLWSEAQAAAKIASRTALKRWGEADDLVGAAIFLSTPAARYVTGATLAVDGGYAVG